MQAQHYAKTKMDYLVFNGYNSLAVQDKIAIESTEFKDSVDLGTVSTDSNGISHRLVTVNVYKDNETYPRATLKQVFYSNDANKFVTNGSSSTSSISLNYDKDNDRLYAMVDGQEKTLGGDNGVPIGTVITWASWNNPTQNGIWLECNGQSCSSYPALVAVLGSNNVPNYTGAFLRSYGSRVSTHYGTITHLSDALGSLQGDAIREIGGWFGGWDIQPTAFADKGFAIYSRGNWVNQGGYYSDSAAYGIDFYASRCVPVANEIRPLNVAVRYFIKAA